MQDIIEQLERDLAVMFHEESSGHDMNHLKRVMNIAQTIQEKEGGDPVVITVAAFLHDIHRIMQKETGKFCSPADSLPKARNLLDKVCLSEEQKERILHCIEFHEEYAFTKTGKTVKDIETLILQDADNLDAIGAIGIGRTFAFGGAHNISMWEPKKPFDRNTYDEAEEDPSTIHHFYSKLLKLKDNMNTATAKAMADKRHEFMERFLDEFFDEWKGKR